MNKYEIIWIDIKNDNIDYTIPDAGLTNTDIYITDNYVFKSGSDVDINMYINREARDIGVKAPKPYYYSCEDNFVAYEKINGDILYNIKQDKMVEAGFKAGKELKKMHERKYEGYGEINDLKKCKTGEYQDYRKYFNSELKSYTDVREDSKFKEYVDPCYDIASSITVPEKTESSLLHNDLNSGNVMVEKDTVYIIDFERGYFGESDTDFLKSYLKLRRGVGEDAAEGFADGYGQKISNLKDYHLCEVILDQCSGGIWREKNNLELGGRENDIKELMTILKNQVLN